MAITRKRKEELVSQYSDYLEQSSGFIIMRYRKMSVSQVERLRAKIREAEGQYLVTKNTLLTKALQQQGWPLDDDLLSGPTGVAFGMGNLPGVAKAVLDFLKDAEFEERLELAGGIMMTDILKPNQVEAVSKLPTMDEIRAQLIGMLTQPQTGLVTVLNSATGQVVNVLSAATSQVPNVLAAYLAEKGGDAA